MDEGAMAKATEVKASFAERIVEDSLRSRPESWNLPRVSDTYRQH
jgi:hypothetical protein